MEAALQHATGLAAAISGGGGGYDGDSGTVYLSPVAVATAAALLVVQSIVSFRLSLGLHWQVRGQG